MANRIICARDDQAFAIYMGVRMAPAIQEKLLQADGDPETPVVIVENLFVHDWARRLGVGRRLMAAAAAEARRRGVTRLEMNVCDDSLETRAFYERLGVRPAGEVVYRVEDDALAALAATNDGQGPA